MAAPHDLQAAVLAGGLGTRLRTVVADRPKVLAEVGGRPFLAYLLDRLVEARIGEVVLCTGYMAEQVERVMGTAYGPLRLRYSREDTPLGTGGALRLALPRLTARTVLVMNGDSLCDLDVSRFCRWHADCAARATLLLLQVQDAGRYGQVRFDPDHRVTSFAEKVAGAGPGWVNAGVYLIERALIESVPSGRSVSLEREVFPGWVGRGLYACPAAGAFLDIGTPESFGQAAAFVRREGSL